MNSLSNLLSLQHSIISPLRVLAEEFHDIASPVDYSLIPPWLVFVIAFVVLSLLGLVVWWFVQRRKPELPPKAPREIALGELEQIRPEIQNMNPYQFSIRVSDVLRRYVTQQYGVPATRQTSIEFLTAAAKAPSFSADDKSLLEDFLSRCDLIKFAKYEATTADSELLLEEAISFVKGGQLAAV
jgi:predicted pyridoxine 5'-phosphate oxidase superfamily flavin-nucleotide-binding protein